jgi:cytochrome c-type biogenesis protein CcmH/NrfF
MCFWTLPALLLGVVMLIMGLVHGHNQKKREKEFEEKMNEEGR